MLGLAETIGPFANLFELVNRAHKIYRKKEGAVRVPLTFLTNDWAAATLSSRPGPPAFRRQTSSASPIASRSRVTPRRASW